MCVCACVHACLCTIKDILNIFGLRLSGTIASIL